MRVVLVLAAALAAGCGGVRGHVADVAASQHGCPRDRVHVESDAGHWTYWVSVCGRRRLYSAADSRVEDITSTVSAGGRVTAGPAPPSSSWAGREVEEFRDATAAGVLGCFPADRSAVRVRITVGSRGTVSYSRVVSAATAAEQECVRTFLADATSGTTADRSRTGDVGYDRDRVPAPPAPASPATTDPLRAAVESRRDAVLACVGGIAVACELTVAPGGAVTVALRGALAGSAEESCVRAVLDGIAAAEPARVVLHVVTP